MAHLDDEGAAALRAALGLAPGDPDPPDPVAAAEALNTVAAIRADAGAVLLIAVGMVRRAQARGGTFEAARAAVGSAGWPLGTVADVADLVTALTAMAAGSHDADDLDRAAAHRRGAAVMAGKVCTRCGRAKPLAAYHRDRTKPDGRRPRCKDCVNAEARQPGGRGPLTRIPPDATAKRCLGPCGRVLPLEAFGTHWRGQGGRTARCLECVRAAKRQARAAAA